MTGRRTIPPLKALATLECVVRHRSVSLAADELCLTHGAVSKQLGTLATWIGQPLFADNRRRMVPTAAASRLARGVEAGMTAIYQALDDVQGDAASQQNLRVIAPATLAMYWLIPRLPALRRSGLRIKAHVRYTHTQDNWQEQPFDIAIRSDGDTPSDCRRRPLFADRLGLVAAPDVGAAIDCRDALRGLTVLESETRPGELDAWLASVSRSRHDLGAIEVFEHNYVAIEAALIGTGAVLAPLAVVGNHLARGSLVQVLPDCTVSGPRFAAVYRPRSKGSRPLQGFMDWLESCSCRSSERMTPAQHAH